MEKTYQSALGTRYASSDMRYLFSSEAKIVLWRTLWTQLAKAQKELGVNIPDGAIEQMENEIYNIDYNNAAEYEKKFRHDVVAHIHTFGDVAPIAKGIIHLGATSQYVVDNADVLTMRYALEAIRTQLVEIITKLSDLALKYAATPCCAYTHFQPAQMTTVGKRMIMWCESFVRDLDDLEYRLANLEFPGIKGATGTQASFLELFDGDVDEVLKLERMVAHNFQFYKIASISGQTYNRKIDVEISQVLGGIAVSVHKMCNDIRLLSNLGEMEEPHSNTQVGSSAMPYKKNPIKCENATGIARFLMNSIMNPMNTAAEQWLERTLDDSSNKRLAMPEMFLSANSILGTIIEIVDGLVINEEVISEYVDRHLPFMTTEYIIMECVKQGGDRQWLHEKMRQIVAKSANGSNLIMNLKIQFGADIVNEVLNPELYIGLAERQVRDFVNEIKPMLG